MAEIHNNIHLPIEVWNIIFDKSGFIEQIRVRQVHKDLLKLQIVNLHTIDGKYLYLLTDNILLNYPHIKFLNAHDNKKITSVNHMSKLIKLNAGCQCGIGDDGIKDINLEILNAYNNVKITSLNHMPKLINLNAGYHSGIGDNGIKDINLQILNTWNNSKITSVNHMSKLINLDAGWNCGIGNDGIKDINLQILNAWDNDKIISVNYMSKLIQFNGKFI